MFVPDDVLEGAPAPDVAEPEGLEVVERRAEQRRVGGGVGGGVGEEPAEVAMKVRRGGRDERGRPTAEGGEGGGRDPVRRRAEEERRGVRVRSRVLGARRRQGEGGGGGDEFGEEAGFGFEEGGDDDGSG